MQHRMHIASPQDKCNTSVGRSSQASASINAASTVPVRSGRARARTDCREVPRHVGNSRPDIFEKMRHAPGSGWPGSGCRGRDRGPGPEPAVASLLLRVRLGGWESSTPTPRTVQLLGRGAGTSAVSLRLRPAAPLERKAPALVRGRRFPERGLRGECGGPDAWPVTRPSAWSSFSGVAVIGDAGLIAEQGMCQLLSIARTVERRPPLCRMHHQPWSTTLECTQTSVFNGFLKRVAALHQMRQLASSCGRACCGRSPGCSLPPVGCHRPP